MPKIMIDEQRIAMCKVCANYDPWGICPEEEDIETFTTLDMIECCTDFKLSQEKYNKLKEELNGKSD